SAAPGTPSWTQDHLPSDGVGPCLDPLPVGSGRHEPASRVALSARPRVCAQPSTIVHHAFLAA
ncbi:MAG TPA: hypothetical protein VK714_11500, partial [Myxococcota bacterium]|nr:hypothetical protein [Myxococcota bacterium]